MDEGDFMQEALVHWNNDERLKSCLALINDTQVIDMHSVPIHMYLHVRTRIEESREAILMQMLQGLTAQSETDHKSEPESPPTD